LGLCGVETQAQDNVVNSVRAKKAGKTPINSFFKMTSLNIFYNVEATQYSAKEIIFKAFVSK